MTNIYALCNHFELREYQTAITRADFETHFKATKEKVTFTFGGGWQKLRWRKPHGKGLPDRYKRLRRCPVHQSRQGASLYRGRPPGA